METVDVAVIGGGPAGAVAARALAGQGARVLLADPDRTPARLEGIGERLMAWLRAEGLADRLPDVSPLVPRRASWAGEETAHNGEHLVERASMDRALRAAAVEAGAELATATATLQAKHDAVRVRLSDGREVSARRVIDARGRAAHANRPVTRGPATLAVGGWLSGEAEAGAAVTPFADGWVWIARPGDGRVWTQATLDARADDAPPAERLRAALAEVAPHLAGEPQGLSIRECAPVVPTGAIDPRVLPAGDAAAGMDPLSGHGMFWAVSGALAAVAAWRTLEERPGPDSEDLATRYIGERIRETYLRQARLGRDFLRQETRFQDRPFWARRLGFPDDAPVHEAAEPGVTTAIVVVDGLLEEREVIVTEQEPAGVAFIADIPVVEAWRRLQQHGPADLAAEHGEAKARAVVGWLTVRGLIST
ncbi:NAD(P)/FAD-dependent oxidoreductase [Caenispirillum salinarum]|uniref:flavin-dependent monooxygenase QhpG n=1 Tax=Caenispirillum salinarum TaxID=859058 RepID=UPI00384F3B20